MTLNRSQFEKHIAPIVGSRRVASAFVDFLRTNPGRPLAADLMTAGLAPGDAAMVAVLSVAWSGK